ncbi:hypothetical protein F2P45_13900 [Massilia sp. CCM 8733]|uniref:Immunity MXAN-0049 protein domain-containing protein n=1 Tax=Massilia mucilaginosa TaxID=2609282 RepID=A0ABX0NTI2_9BURK|nr:DUF1629 domain-containing protein [Massilia mucilaginosa]NHZ90100.1 hypothetical protein [Massilia mucilaginosa]
MNSTGIFKLLGDSDKYPGFLQTYLTSTEQWEEDIASRCAKLGAKPFGPDYTPVPLEFANRRKKRKAVGDFSFRLAPFLILSETARNALNEFLSPVGEFLEVDAPVEGFIGYRVLLHICDCVNLEKSDYSRYDNGNILVRKPVLYEEKVANAHIFSLPEAPTSVFVSQKFKDAVESAKLTGFDFTTEVPLTSIVGSP